MTPSVSTSGSHTVNSLHIIFPTSFGFFSFPPKLSPDLALLVWFDYDQDIKDAYQKVRGITDEAQKAEGMTKWFASDLPEWLGKLEKALASTSKSTACSVRAFGYVLVAGWCLA